LSKDDSNKKIHICTVIGFPNGYTTTKTKVYETWDAVNNGADEIDMVVNIGKIKGKEFNCIKEEINDVKRACNGKILKVIIETCLLSKEEKITMCKLVSESDADFIKTSTGFAGGGATFEDVALMRDNCSDRIKIKAAGGIKSLDDAEKFINLGASRLGTSRIIKIVKENKNDCRYNKLIEKAETARSFSYCVYSGFAVGAALECADGRIYTGCNIENSSFSPTICAERTAFSKAVSNGERSFTAIAIVGGEKDKAVDNYCPPCGVCRQFMSEFCDKGFNIILAKRQNDYKIFRLEELLPESFSLK
jgi:deoxyribose-phosphate aldolase